MRSFRLAPPEKHDDPLIAYTIHLAQFGGLLIVATALTGDIRWAYGALGLILSAPIVLGFLIALRNHLRHKILPDWFRRIVNYLLEPQR